MHATALVGAEAVDIDNAEGAQLNPIERGTWKRADMNDIMPLVVSRESQNLCTCECSRQR